MGTLELELEIELEMEMELELEKMETFSLKQRQRFSIKIVGLISLYNLCIVFLILLIVRSC